MLKKMSLLIMSLWGGVAFVQGQPLPKGTIFFSPETDIKYTPQLVRNNAITGTELFTSWGLLEREEGQYNWHYLDSLIAIHHEAGKKVSLRIVTASFSINDTPDYIFTKYNVRRIAAGYWENFEAGDKGYILHAPVTEHNPLAGQKSLRIKSTRNTKILETGENQRFLKEKGITNPTHHPDMPSRKRPRTKGFCFQFDYRAEAKSRFYVRAYSESDPSKETRQSWQAATGERGSKTFTFYPETDDYKVELHLQRGDLTVDNVNICDRVTGYVSGTLCFPNYFDPVFLEKYEIFVKALAEKYGNHPDVAAVCAGGYGRWEEMTLSHEDAGVFEDQWPTFGFTNDKYADHIKSCIDLYVKYFPDKQVYTGAVGWNTDAYRDQGYIDYKIGTYAASRGVGIKYNGWQALCSEWQSDGTGFFYAANRYRHTPGADIFFEESHQVNGFPFMGHPLSLINRALIANMDYAWVYCYDLTQEYFNKYLHYFNEQAGSALITKLYNRFERHDYLSPRWKRPLILKNRWMGLYQLDDIYETEYDYVDIDGVKAVETGEKHRDISISIDDRLRYNGMYGAVLSIDYLDRGTDRFTVKTLFGTEMQQIASVTKAGTGEWKTLHVRDTGWTGKSRNNGPDDPVEILIDDCGDGTEIIHMMELNQVPAGEWQERIVEENPVHGTEQIALDKTYRFEIIPEKEQPVSGISINVGGSAAGRVDIRARITAVVAGNRFPVVEKHFYLPLESDWFYLPTAQMPYADSYTVEVDGPEGEGFLNMGEDRVKPAYRVHAFRTVAGDRPKKTDGTFTALRPFCALNIDGILPEKLLLERILFSGNSLENIPGNTYGPNTVYFEPQTAGHYRLCDASGNPVQATPVYLQRLAPAKEPVRELLGELKLVLSGPAGFEATEGWGRAWNDETGFHAEVDRENPFVEAQHFTFSADREDRLHLVIKNETASSLAKLYWKHGAGDYTEANSVLIPIVPDDEHYREYCFPVGLEERWQGEITGLRLIPVTGHTDAGMIHIHQIVLRNGNGEAVPFGSGLEIEKTSFGMVTVEK